MIIFVSNYPGPATSGTTHFSPFKIKIMSCDPACFECKVNACSDIILRAGIEAATTYNVLIKKIGSDNLYQRKITSTTVDTVDQLLIEKSLFPDGFFTPGNNYWLQLRTDADYTVIAPIPFSDPPVEYNCVIFSLVQFNIQEGDTSELNVIGESEEEIPE